MAVGVNGSPGARGVPAWPGTDALLAFPEGSVRGLENISCALAPRAGP